MMNNFRVIVMWMILGVVAVSCNLPGQPPTSTPSEGDVLPEGVTVQASPSPTRDEAQAAAPQEASETPETMVTPSVAALTKSMSSIKRMNGDDPLVIQEIRMIDALTGWAIGGASGNANSVFRTVNGGVEWREVTPPQDLPLDAPWLAQGAFLDGDSAWVLYHPQSDTQPGRVQDLIIWQTQDGGAEWRPGAPARVEFIGAEFAPTRISFANPSLGWVLARYGGAGMHRYPVYLLRSEDAGASWTILEDPYEGLYLQGCPKTGWAWDASGVGIITIGFCPFESAEIHITQNLGETWESIRLPFPEAEIERLGSASCEAHSPLIIDGDTIMLASACPFWGDETGIVNLLYRTSDYGSTWEILAYPGGELFSLDGLTLLALDEKLYKSEDGGSSWAEIKQVSWEGQFSWINPMQGWAVARSEGEIALVRTENGGETWQLLEPILLE